MTDLCRKCHEKRPTIVLRNKDYYCNDCFLTYFVHKFRSTIGKSKEIKHNDKILVGFSGGLSSTALLYLIKDGLDGDTAKQLRFEPSFLYIDESSASPCKPNFNAICKAVLDCKFPLYFTYIEEILKEESVELHICSLESVKNPDLSVDDSLTKNSNHREKLKTLLSSNLKSATSREDLISHLRDELTRRCAKQLGFRKVFVATSGTQLAVRILSDIALGRGAQLADHVQFKATSFGVEVYRPMRELFQDEIRHYVLSQKISIPNEESELLYNNSSGIISCTRDFVFGLQKEFVSTVPTIFKTGGKLVKNSNAESDPEDEGCLNSETFGREKRCSLCGLHRDTEGGHVSALEAIKVSKRLSAKRPSTGQPLRISGDQHDHQKCDQFADDIYSHFCYGCGNLVQEIGDLSLLPPRVRDRVEKTKNQNLQ